MLCLVPGPYKLLGAGVVAIWINWFLKCCYPSLSNKAIEIYPKE